MNRQCWAHNSKGDRCQKPPGHKGFHQISIRWEDSECLTPSGQPPQGRPLVEVFAEAEQQPTRCIACGHLHKGGECKCGCHEHIG